MTQFTQTNTIKHTNQKQIKQALTGSFVHRGHRNHPTATATAILLGTFHNHWGMLQLRQQRAHGISDSGVRRGGIVRGALVHVLQHQVLQSRLAVLYAYMT